MPIRFTQKAQNVLNRALTYAGELGHTYIGSEHILLGLLGESDSVASGILGAKGADFEKLRDAVIEYAGMGTPGGVRASDMTPRTKHIIEASSIEAVRHGQNYIGTEHLLAALLSEDDCVALSLLENAGVSISDLRSELASYFGSKTETMHKSSREATSGTGRQSKSGGSLADFGRDLTAMAREGKIDPVIGRDDETERVVRILSRRGKNNPCLIGEPGVGKTAVVEGLAQKIVDGNVPENLRDKRIITLDIAGMLAGAKYRGEFEERMKSVMEEVSKSPDTILFIDEIHTIIGAGAAEGAVDAANILKPALARGEMQVIGATTIAEYRAHIEKDAALERRFQPVMVGEPSPEEAIAILMGLRDKYEAHHKVKISDEAIKASVELSRRYIADRYLPDKAIDLVDEAASGLRISAHTSPPDLKAMEESIAKLGREKEEAIRAQDFEGAARIRDEEKKANEDYAAAKQAWEKSNSDKELTVSENDIADVVTRQTGIPVTKLLEDEGEKLLHLEEELHRRIIGQDNAVSAVARAIRRGRMGLRDPKRPIGSFIFLGPTGVGKTELTKALASIMFGDENAMIRLDMSEYMEKHSVSKLIGSPPGYVGFDEGGQLTEKIRRRPYSVVLFDEIEKAHPDVFNIMLQVLEDGILTDSQVRRVDFKNTIIIMTSNVGATAAATQSRALGFGEASTSDAAKADEKMLAALRQTFRPEFLNRIDDIIVFSKLTGEDISRIAEIMLREVASRMASLGVNIEFDKSVTEAVTKEGFDDTYGARPLRRAIVRMIEDSFSTEMLEGKIKKGDSVTAIAADGKIAYEVK